MFPEKIIRNFTQEKQPEYLYISMYLVVVKVQDLIYLKLFDIIVYIFYLFKPKKIYN